ncbi:MFS transporter [Adhaeribacter aquaticus]|uniref:MFS transporter n=1 Tax=Adhaeribacter aquaticus TaxID=299567 RepID=UPI0004028A6C|nr:MFS transporter [Adhaeribacter aquaticus]
MSTTPDNTFLTSNPEETLVPKAQIREGWLLFLLATIQFTHIIDFVIMMPLGPQLMRVFQINPKEFGFMVSAYTFSAAISGFISTLFIDKFDRKNALLALYAGFIFGTFCCAIAPTYELLLVARIIAGAFGGVIGALVFAIIGDAIPENRRGAATGKVMAAFSVASIAGVPVGLYLASKVDWHAPFYALAAMSLLVLIGAYFLLPALRGHLTNAVKTNPLAVVGEILRNKNLLWAMTLMVALTLAGFTVVPFVSPYLVANVGFAESELAFMYLFGGLATVVTSQLAGRLSDRYGKQRIFIYTALFSIIPILAITHLQPAPHYLVLMVTTTFFIGFGARFVPAMSLITSSVSPNLRGSFMSFNSSVQQMAAGLSAFLSGLIIQKSSTGPLLHFGTIGIIATVATILCLFIVRQLKVIS